MIIYQVVDEENNLVSEHSQLNVAMHSAEDWTVWHEDHYYHVEALALRDIEEIS